LLDKHSTTWTTSPGLFILVIFQIESHLFALPKPPQYLGGQAWATGPCQFILFLSLLGRNGENVLYGYWSLGELWLNMAGI
jgi:hypothetical protein